MIFPRRYYNLQLMRLGAKARNCPIARHRVDNSVERPRDLVFALIPANLL
jgi:hypothetical protein